MESPEDGRKAENASAPSENKHSSRDSPGGWIWRLLQSHQFFFAISAAVGLGLAMGRRRVVPALRSYLRAWTHSVRGEQPETISLSEALRRISTGTITQLWYPSRGHVVQMATSDGRLLKTHMVPGSDTPFFTLASQHVPHFDIQHDPPVILVAIQALGPLCLMFAWWKMMQSLLPSSESSSFWARRGGTVLTFWERLHFRWFSSTSRRDTRLPHRLTSPSQPSLRPVTFADVVSPAKEDVYEVVELLNHPDRFADFGVACPRGLLLVGPSGTGKTLLAKAVAEEARVAFLSCSASQFVELYVGRGAKRIRDVFEEARAQAPSILFIDELDALGTRGTTGGGFVAAQDEYVQTINQLLTEMDGISGREDGVLIIGATNRLQAIDSALLRPGRFDSWISLELPSSRDRLEILKVSIRRRNVPMESGAVEHLPSVAHRAAGWSGAELDNFVNEAAFTSYRRIQGSTVRDYRGITKDDLDQAFLRCARRR